jgi:hypothetical protein
VLDPIRINQGRTGLCGPAALAIEVARSRPDEYAQFAADLARIGRGQIRGYAVNPSTHVRNYRIQRNAVPEADFLVLASLRDSNALLDATTNLGRYQGTSQVEVFNWCVACGYQRVVMYLAPPKIILRSSHIGISALSLVQSAVFEITKSFIAPFPPNTPIVQLFPLLSAPLFYPFETRLEFVEEMARLLRQGNKVLLLCHAHLAEAAESFSRAVRDGLTMLGGEKEANHGKILREWAGHGKNEALRALAKIDAAPHWVFLDQFLVTQNAMVILASASYITARCSRSRGSLLTAS